MIEKLESIVKRYQEVEQNLLEPGVSSRQDEWKKLTRERAALMPIVEKYQDYSKYTGDLSGARQLLAAEKDKEMVAMLEEEIDQCEEALEKLEGELKILLLPKDINDERNVIIEIRAAAGGDEAGLFGMQLMKMYQRYAESRNWQVEDLDTTITECGGIKESVFMIKGNGAYAMLKYESGAHRVQRVPETESQGRIHTSTVTVAVLPEAEDVEVEIIESDLRIDAYRASGAGGQHVNKTESAIRITHLPTNIVVQSQDERSQIKNRERAMRVLKSRLYDYYQQKATDTYAANRKSLVGTGDRSERIRTYNFPQGRITDHRINYTQHSIEKFMQGELQNIIDALIMADNSEKLKAYEG